jgi:N-acyl amino acid synthase of PEP-CTERM/exosortase system
MADLITAFNESFEVVPADSPELLREVFHLRYQVYSEEGIIPDFESWKYPDGLETDEFDHRYIHCLCRHRPSGQIAGTVRLVLADPEDPLAPFPIEHHVGQSFDPARVNPQALPRRQVGEISRLMLTQRFRSRQGEVGVPDGVAQSLTFPEPEDRRRFPHSILGLFVAIGRMTTEHGLTHLYAAMEPRLARLLRRFGIYFPSISPVVEYHGLRQCFLVVAAQVMDRIRRERPEVWELLTDRGRLRPGG